MWTQVLIAAALLAAGCSTRCGLTPCDIRMTACQRQTAEGAACLRGVAPPEVPVTVVKRGDYMAAAAREATTATQAERLETETWIVAMGMLGLGSPDLRVDDLVAQQAGWVGGQYSPADKAITVIDDGYPLDSLEQVGLLAHEYVHALQDRDVDLGAFDQRTIRDTDSGLAAAALVEGEAAFVQDLAALSEFGTEEEQVGWPALFARWQDAERRDAQQIDNPALLAISQFPYAYGSSLVHDRRAGGGWEAVSSSYAAPPATTREVLAAANRDGPHPFGSSPAVDLRAVGLPDLPGFEVSSADTLGSWLFEIFLQRLGADAFHPGQDTAVPDPKEVGQLLQGDVLAVLRRESSVVVAWRLRLVDQTAGILASWLKRRRFNAWVAGPDVVIVVTNDPSLGAQLVPAALTFKPVPPRMTMARAAAGPTVRCRGQRR